MAQFPGLTIWTDAWVADTYHLTCEQEGVYFRLMWVMWRTPGCRVPNDVGWLANHMRMTEPEVVSKVLPIIEQFCSTDGNWVWQKRLKREFVRRFQVGAAQSVRAKHREKNKKNSTRGAPAGDATLPYPTVVVDPSFPTAAREEKKADGRGSKQASAALEEAVRAKGWKPSAQPDYTPGEGLEDIVRRKGWT